MQYSYVPVNGEPVILEGVQVPRAGLQFPAEYHLFNKYVPKVLNRYINNVLSNYINDIPGDTLEEVNFLKQFKQATGGDPVASQTNPLTGGIEKIINVQSFSDTAAINEKALVFVAEDETNDGQMTAYFHNGQTLNWLPSVEV